MKLSKNLVLSGCFPPVAQLVEQLPFKEKVLGSIPSGRTMEKRTITVQTLINAPVEKVWECFTRPEHIMNWAFASDDWEASEAENDLRVGGKFRTRMQAKDKSAGFDFTGVYTQVLPLALIEYNMDDGRHVKTELRQTPDGVKITQTFDPENENSEEMQRSGWQAILDNFKKYAEA